MTLRPGGRLRAGLSGVVGRLEGAVAVRGEGVATFVLAPAKRRGWTVYGGGGAALVWSDGNYAEYALVVLGAEARPAARAGWFLEVGAGRGVRLAGGVRFHLGGRRRP